MPRLTSSFTCQLISVIITTLAIHHSFTPGSKPTFSTNPSHLNTQLYSPSKAATIKNKENKEKEAK